MTNKTILKRCNDFMNPYSLVTDKKNIEINHIVFFDSEIGKEILTEGNTNIRWFGKSSNNEFPTIIFDFETPKKSKEINFTNKKPFYINYESRYNFDKGKIVLYIPIQLLNNFKYLGEVFDFETETEIKYKPTYSFDVNASKIDLHECNKTKENNFKGYEYRTSEIKEHTIIFNDYYKTVLKPLGEKIELISNKLNEIGIENVYKYDLEKMLSAFDIELKNN